MGFFDDISRKFASAGQATIQRTKEISDVARLGALITQNEGKIRSLYYQIGKRYVSVRGRDEELDKMVAEVARLEEEIAGYNDQIQSLKNTQRCERCGAEIPKGSAFCDNCGAPVQPVAADAHPESVPKCPRCGAEVKMGMRFCTHCGQALELNAPTNTEVHGFASREDKTEMPEEDIRLPDPEKTDWTVDKEFDLPKPEEFKLPEDEEFDLTEPEEFVLPEKEDSGMPQE